MRKKKRKSIYVPNKQLNLTNWIPHHDKEYYEIETDSWFDFKCFDNPKPYRLNKYHMDYPIIPLDSYKQQMKLINRRKLNKEPIFIYSRKIKLYPDNNQKQILDSWFNAFTKMFNITITFIRRKLKAVGKYNIKEANKICNFEKVRSYLYDDKHHIQSLMEHKINIHILDEAIHLAVSNYKTCLSNLKKGHIKKYRIREWSLHKKRKILKIESSLFKNYTFCPSIFPVMKSSPDLVDIDHTCTLQYNSETGKYILFVPSCLETQYSKNREIACGIDLGVRTFASIYSKNNVFSVCNKVGDKYKIKSYHNKIDIIHRLLNEENKNQTIEFRKKIKKKIITDVKDKTINRTNLKRALRKYHRKITNMVTDMHYKIAYKIVNDFDEVYIGKLSTKKILSKNNVKISRKTKRMVGVLSPYLFRKRLIYMGYKYGSIVKEIDEYMTTITCTNCGKINKLGKSKIHECECGMEADRDENAAKNILKVGLVEKDEK